MSGFKIGSSPSQEHALTNLVYVNPDDRTKIKGDYVEIGGMVFNVATEKLVTAGSIALNGTQRRSAKVSQGDPINLVRWDPPIKDAVLSKVTFDVDFVNKTKTNPATIKGDELAENLRKKFVNQVFTTGQSFAVDFQGVQLMLTVGLCEAADLESLMAAKDNEKGSDEESGEPQEKEVVEGKASMRGILVQVTDIDLTSKATKIDWGDKKSTKTKQLFVSGFNFNDLGIGGLDAEFSTIFRRAFASRVFSSSIVAKLGINHVRGMLLYGPPGTGKTMIARKIGQILNAKPPKIVNGPEILNKYVGQSEENIRNLFLDAEREYKEKGEDSELHIIIFDEIDAICKQRGTTGGGTGVGDTVVNQLLSKMDGVDSLNNILVIGMTNRKDMIDEALLRPGRLEVHMEIGLPDEAGRLQILKIHTKKMTDAGFLDKSVDLKQIAKEIKNFSGADIEGLCKAATSFAFSRQVDVHKFKTVEEKNIKITMEDFERARAEVGSSFAVDPEEFESKAPNGIINYGSTFSQLRKQAEKLVELIKSSSKTPNLSFLLEGPTGAGKTALAAELAQKSGFAYTKFVSAEQFVGATEFFKCNKLTKTFEDAYKTPAACIVIDDIERIIEYVPIGQRFSNLILQTLLVCMKRVPPKNRKILIIVTTSNAEILDQMELLKTFTAAMHVPKLGDKDEIEAVLKASGAFKDEDIEAAADLVKSKIPIKKLLTVIELAREGGKRATLRAFEEALETLDA